MVRFVKNTEEILMELQAEEDFTTPAWQECLEVIRCSCTVSRYCSHCQGIKSSTPPPTPLPFSDSCPDKVTQYTTRTFHIGTGPCAMWGCLLILQHAVPHCSSPNTGCTPLLLQAFTAVPPHLVLAMQRLAQPDWHGFCSVAGPCPSHYRDCWPAGHMCTLQRHQGMHECR
jgi:hypothetical protein